jgi:signal transduction histidine kinase
MNSTNNYRKKNQRYVIIALLISIVMGLVCDYFYKTSDLHAIKIEQFQSQLIDKEQEASQTTEALKQIIIHTSIDSLIHYPFKNSNVSYYVFENNELVFWSDNNHDISSLSLADSSGWQYILLGNAHCVSNFVSFNSTKILALVKIKNNYPYQNKELVNGFAPGFEMDKQVQIIAGKKTDKLAVFSSHNDYLFSLSDNQHPIYNENWSIGGLIGYGLAFIIFLFLYANSPYLLNRKSLSLKTYGVIIFGVGLFIALCLYFNFPDLLFWNKYFSPFQYASNPFLSSICHLSVATGYFLATIYLFYFHVNTDKIKSVTARIVIITMFTLYFSLLYYLLSGIIYHSSIQLTILQFYDFSVIKIWIYFLILMWGISLTLLFLKTHSWFKSNHKHKLVFIIEAIISVVLFITYQHYLPEEALRITISYIALWLSFYLSYILNKTRKAYGIIAFWTLIYTLFIIFNSVVISNIKKYDKYKILAQNIYINGNTENDPMADILLEELNSLLLNDKKIAKLVANTDSLSIANDYLNKTYLRGFWNKYDMRLNAAPIGSETYKVYKKFILSMGIPLKNTHFFTVPANENNMSYIGEFQTKTSIQDTIVYFMEFYPRRNFKSYSFPNLLIATTPEIQTQLDIAIAKYERKKLVYSSGKIEFSAINNWIPNKKSNFFTVVYNHRIYYVYTPQNNTQIIITEQQLHNPEAYLLYFSYTFLVYFSICSLIVWGFSLARRKTIFRVGLTAKFQYAFILLLIFSFLLIFYVSVNFIEKKYQQEQITNLESKKSYIQKALQDMYYWNQELTNQNMVDLNFDLQELSYTYHTDIHVYNNSGVLVGSSQPIIFNKKLISNRIAPIPYFTQNANMNQYEHIGMLNYLTGYTDFLNGDYLQIGYISVPQFFSQDEISNEIESFLAVIIHIYLIVILLVILVSLFIGRQLSAPLNMLENKLKEMRLGRRNEKIDYKLNDEIGQLVLQYNRTIDELEQSAKLLAKSERESAWKSMARQVAHEINNPLTPMKLTIQQLQRTKSMNDERFDDYFQKSAVMLIEQIDNLSRIAGTFSDFARMPEANFERTDVALKLNSVLHLFVSNNEQVDIDYQGVEMNVFVFADPEQLVQVFNNLLKNAIQAIPAERNGKINVSLQTNDKQVVIKITDNGTGILEEVHDKLFAPNFTTKTTGMGLGLAISKNIVELSGGTISFESKNNEGTTFTVTFPKADR